MDGNKIFRVENRCNYDIGVTLTTGQAPNIRRGSFLPLSVNEILFIESNARRRRPFSSGELVAVTDDGKDLTLSELGGYEDTYSTKHYSNDEITANLKKSAKQVAEWLKDIEDPVELHAICEVAKAMDLPSSKLRILKEKCPATDLLEE